jgi:hypothetical protein
MALSGGRNSARARIAVVSAELAVGRRGRRSFLRPGNVSFVFNGGTVMPLFLRSSAIEPAPHQHQTTCMFPITPSFSLASKAI